VVRKYDNTAVGEELQIVDDAEAIAGCDLRTHQPGDTCQTLRLSNERRVPWAAFRKRSLREFGLLPR